ncbi:MAG: hypothetical protein SF051_01545 [Elusimicrobiota bacterium]|nr:hypothetical protein [Elusimicrobiota bacterium]
MTRALAALLCAAVLAAPAAAESVPAFDDLLAPEALSTLPEARSASLVSEPVVELVSVSAPADEQPPLERLSCDGSPSLCRGMRRVAVLSSTECRGRACYGIWGENRRALHAFNREYDRTAPWRYAATEEFGLEAARSARAICAVSIRNADPDFLGSLVVAMNETLSRLRVAQRAARRQNVVFCRMSLQ